MNKLVFVLLGLTAFAVSEVIDNIPCSSGRDAENSKFDGMSLFSEGNHAIHYPFIRYDFYR
jgi:hypothetical protein